MLYCSKCTSAGVPNAATFACLDELEIHLCTEHFHLFIYSCPYCTYSRFPTEFSLLAHYETVHNVGPKYNNKVQITYTLDENTIQAKRHIQDCLNKAAFAVKSEIACESGTATIGHHRSNPSALPITDLQVNENDDIIWLGDEEVESHHATSSITDENHSTSCTGVGPFDLKTEGNSSYSERIQKNLSQASSQSRHSQQDNQTECHTLAVSSTNEYRQINVPQEAISDRNVKGETVETPRNTTKTATMKKRVNRRAAKCSPQISNSPHPKRHNSQPACVSTSITATSQTAGTSKSKEMTQNVCEDQQQAEHQLPTTQLSSTRTLSPNKKTTTQQISVESQVRSCDVITMPITRGLVKRISIGPGKPITNKTSRDSSMARSDVSTDPDWAPSLGLTSKIRRSARVSVPPELYGSIEMEQTNRRETTPEPISASQYTDVRRSDRRSVPPERLNLDPSPPKKRRRAPTPAPKNQAHLTDDNINLNISFWGLRHNNNCAAFE